MSVKKSIFTPAAARQSRTALLVSTLLVLTACASTPEPAPQVAEPKPAMQDEAPVFQERAAPLPQQSLEGVVAAPFPAQPLGAGPTPGSVDDFVQSAGDRVFFAYNQYSLSNEARNVLRNQAQWMSSYPNVIAVIGGHADERGTREYNLALGARRADAVRDFLISQGVDPRRITTVSYGKERPIDGRSNEEAWALNRNGHTAIVSGASS